MSKNAESSMQASPGTLKEKKRKEKTTPFGVNLMTSPVLYRAVQAPCKNKTSWHKPAALPQLGCNTLDPLFHKHCTEDATDVAFRHKQI